jgi:hypothetical protein
MFAKKTALALLGAVAFTAGCIQYRYGNERACLQLAEAAEVDAPTRAKVHIFLMDGLGTIHALEQVELGIVKAGFPKVYTAQRVDRAWFYGEIHRLHRESSHHRFVLVAQGAAAKEMQRLANDLVQDDIPVDGLIFLDPVGLPTEPCDPPIYPVQVLRGPGSCEAVIEHVMAVARGIPQKHYPTDCVPELEPKPIPRPMKPKVVPPADSKWADVLCPIVGHQ